MKKNTPLLLLIALTLSVMFFSCVSNTKWKASQKRVLQLQKDSAAIANQLALSKASAVKQKITVEEKTIIQEKTITKDVEIPKVNLMPYPPTVVSEKFKITYPDATEVFWFRDNTIAGEGQYSKKIYKVRFKINKENNSLIYEENGDILETRVQILPAQLPPNIYQAIKYKHPSATILSAETYRNNLNNGTYSAIIRATNGTEPLEVILTEKGLFVEK